MNAATQGLILGFSLILAIGSQNAFILRQGILGRHVFVLCSVSALSDALLVIAGVSGVFVLVKHTPFIVDLARYGGASFILWHGISRLLSALRGDSQMDVSKAKQADSLPKALLSCLAFTFLNPHVYLDTVFLIGSISAQFGDESWKFGLGASAASLIFFFCLGYGAALLRPLFSSPVAWRILDFVIGVTMLLLAGKLVFLQT
ncbi:LysE/ArgO family amino acid transporter [Ralstonia solanacearum]|uniref:LysE/ArgO family amino acid transporter n=1 Tax=Ralstonia solanacearum TaxID=305 RepID=UPI0012A1768E|nr:LysE/ArgO family amino acid transporter [Ralstonia solanacearum]AYB60334.1 amino acid transporter [Ralstonia solanacearum]